MGRELWVDSLPPLRDYSLEELEELESASKIATMPSGPSPFTTWIVVLVLPLLHFLNVAPSLAVAVRVRVVPFAYSPLVAAGETETSPNVASLGTAV